MLSKASTIVIIAAAAIAAAVLFSTSSEEMRTRGKDNRTTPTENIKSKSNHTYRMPSSASPEGYFPTNDNRASSVTTANTPPSKEESVAAIHAAAITYDPAFLANIAPHLNSPDPDVRAAAAEGIVVLGDSAGSALLEQFK